jgi:hypothetical protein
MFWWLGALVICCAAAGSAQAQDMFSHLLISVEERRAVINVMVSANSCKAVDGIHDGPPVRLLPPGYAPPVRMMPVTMTLKVNPSPECRSNRHIVRSIQTFELTSEDLEAIIIYTVDVDGKLASVEAVRFPRSGS